MLCLTSVSWFATIFSISGMSAHPKKIQPIKEAGPPQNADEVKSFLQACQFNARLQYRERIRTDSQTPERPYKKKHEISLDFPMPTSIQGNLLDHDQQHSPKTIQPQTKNHSHY